LTVFRPSVISPGDVAILSALAGGALVTAPTEPSPTDDASVVAALRARSGANESLVYAHRVFAEVDALVRRYEPRPPASVLEIGPGANLGPLFCFVAGGVTRAAGVDIATAGERPREFYALLRDYLACVEGWRWWRHFVTVSYPNVIFPATGDDLDVDQTLKKIEYVSPVSSAALPFPDSTFDLVYSVAALEHVEDPRQTVAEILRVLRPGGMAIHEIDLKHHGSPDPLRFLEWSDEEWFSRTERYGGDRSLERILDGSWTGEVFCNRLRHGAWTRLFEEAGLELLHDEPLVLFEPSAIDVERFAEPFRSLGSAELSVLGFRLAGRKR
jgi:SAM-dependent methyltransferase